VTGTQISPTDSSSLIRRLDNSAFNSRHALIYFVLLIGHFFDGYLINVTGVVIPGASETFHIGSGEAGWFSTALFAGMLGGAAIAGIVSDRLGRKYPLAASIFIFAVFSLVAVFAGDYAVLLTARVCQGIGLGAEIAIVLPYIAEFAPARHRGPMVALATAGWLVGLPVAAGIATWVVPAMTWRGMFIIGTIPVLAGVAVVALVPESVRYLLLRGRGADAARVVGRLAPGPAPDPVPGPVHDLAPAPEAPPQQTTVPRQAIAGAVWDLLHPTYLPYTLAIWLMSLCAGAFLYGLGTWLPTVLEHQGTGLLRSFTYTAIISAVGVAGSIVASQTINKLGRRWVLASAFGISGVFCLLWGAVSGTVAIVVLGSLATFFGSGIAGSILFAYSAELYPTTIRATGLGWTAAWQKAGGLIIPTIIGYILAMHTSTYAFFVLFAVISFVAGLAGLVTVETRGKTVEQITADLAVRRARTRPAVTATTAANTSVTDTISEG
jgi:MFS transporter, putative metabolite:H+ symporter